MNFVCAAHNAGLPVVVCHTGQVRQFARSAGRLAKADKLDAHDIAHYGEALQPSLKLLKPELLRQVSELVAVRRQYLGMSTIQKNRDSGSYGGKRRVVSGECREHAARSVQCCLCLCLCLCLCGPHSIQPRDQIHVRTAVGRREAQESSLGSLYA